jgi:AcrR family transcriptional regulator
VATEVGLREKLIAAALKILETEGEEPSLRAVARAAGVSAMAPYRHFPDKAGLLSAVADHGFKTLGRVLAAADDQADAREALFAQGMAYIEFARTNPALFQLMYSNRYGGASTAAVQGTYEVLARRVAGILPMQAAAATLACRAMVQGIAAIMLNGRLAPSQPDDVAAAVRLLVSGLEAGNNRSQSPAAAR